MFLVLVQVQMMRLLTLEGITPDILAVWVVYLALKEGQMRAMFWGFGVGLFYDLWTGDFVGLSTLSMTICGFIAGYFYNENKTQLTLGSYRFLLIVLAATFVHTTIYFIIFTRGTEIGLLRAITQFGITTTLYTATFTLLPMFGFARKYLT